MTSRDRMIKTLRFEEVDRVPRNLWTLPGIGMFRSAELAVIKERFPSDITGAQVRHGASLRARGTPCRIGTYTDEWGTVWEVAEDGIIGEVKHPILGTEADMEAYKLPWELLEGIDFSGLSAQRAGSDRDAFLLCGTQTRPFERLQFLRGTENILMDLAYGSAALERLRDRLHEFSLKEMELVAASDADAVSFMDDWGSQTSLLISPVLWRSFFKPLYKAYCDILHAKGKYVFFHSDGNIEAIYPDLIEIGVNAVNSQLFCMDMEALGAAYAGKIVFWGELDRQFVLPFGTKVEVEAAVARAVRAFIGKDGARQGAAVGRGRRTGVIAQMEWGIADPAANIETAFQAWDRV